MQEFETSFAFACPKFLSPVPPNYDMMGMPTQFKVCCVQLLSFVSAFQVIFALDSVFFSVKFICGVLIFSCIIQYYFITTLFKVFFFVHLTLSFWGIDLVYAYVHMRPTAYILIDHP